MISVVKLVLLGAMKRMRRWTARSAEEKRKRFSERRSVKVQRELTCSVLANMSRARVLI